MSLICIIITLQLAAAVTYSLAKSIWEEKSGEIHWPMVELLPEKSDTPINCYQELDHLSIDHVFHLTLKTKDFDQDCIIKVPNYVNIQYLEIDFLRPDTYVRLISGNDRKRMTLHSRLLTRDSPKDDYGEFPIACMHGYMVVIAGQKTDNLKFEVRPLDMSNMMEEITEEECNEDYLKRKEKLVWGQV
uniref:Uncharacterized protein n=1 Tax=Panagrolaimus sp. JU765 TaxID=591449 RepID=A0AC34RHC0_9BILA